MKVRPPHCEKSKVNRIRGKFHISDDLNTGFRTTHSSLTCCRENGVSNMCPIAPPDLNVYMHVYIRKKICLQAWCKVMNLCMCTCDNKFSHIPKAVILLQTTEVAWHGWYTRHQISSTGHLTGHPIKGATISPASCLAFSRLNLTPLS